MTESLFDEDAAAIAADNNARRDQARRDREDVATVRRLMGHKQSRAWVYRLLAERCHIYDTSFRPGPGEREATFFRLGEEYVGKHIVAQIFAAAPDLYMIMLTEARAEEDRVVSLAANEERKREAEETIGIRMQGFELPEPGGLPPNGFKTE